MTTTDSELTLAEINHEIAHRQRIRRQLEAELANLEQELPALTSQHGELSDQLGVHEGAVVEAFKEANGGDLKPVLIDTYFRMESKRANTVLAEHERLIARANELAQIIKAKHERSIALRNRYLPAARGWIEEAEHVRDQHQANVASAEAAAARGEKPSFAEVARRVLNKP